MFRLYIRLRTGSDSILQLTGRRSWLSMNLFKLPDLTLWISELSISTRFKGNNTGSQSELVGSITVVHFPVSDSILGLGAGSDPY